MSSVTHTEKNFKQRDFQQLLTEHWGTPTLSQACNRHKVYIFLNNCQTNTQIDILILYDYA